MCQSRNIVRTLQQTSGTLTGNLCEQSGQPHPGYYFRYFGCYHYMYVELCWNILILQAGGSMKRYQAQYRCIDEFKTQQKSRLVKAVTGAQANLLHDSGISPYLHVRLTAHITIQQVLMCKTMSSAVSV